MRKYLVLLLFFYLQSCNRSTPELSRPDVDLEGTEQGDYIATPKFQLFDLSVINGDTGVILSGTMTLNLSCDNVFGTSATGDWTMSNVSASSNVSLIQGKACSVSMAQYFDGTNTFSPVNVNSPLTISVSSDGTISPASAAQYTTGGGSPILQWYAASQGAASFTIVINFTNEAVSGNSSVTPTNLAGQTISLTIADVLAPTVSSLLVYNIPGINSSPTSYTLVSNVSNYTSCKYIDNSSNTYTPTSWSSVNTAFQSAQTCPVFVPGQVGFSQGNWTSLWSTGVKTLIIWANTVNGLNAYTTANIGP